MAVKLLVLAKKNLFSILYEENESSNKKTTTAPNPSGSALVGFH